MLYSMLSKAVLIATESEFSPEGVKNEIRNTKTIPRMGSLILKALDSLTNLAKVKSYAHGYPLQAAFQSSESSWSIYRGFNYLHARVILQLQDELRCLEEELTDLDEMDLENGDGARLMSRKDDLQQARREEKVSVRAGLISTIQDKLVTYGM
jgi:hypothetical protein